jgi:hypothetical protein
MSFTGLPSPYVNLVDKDGRINPIWYGSFVSNTALGGYLQTLNNLSELISTAASARANLSVPSTTGSNASGTWGINITGSAGSTISAQSLVSTNTILSSYNNAGTVTNWIQVSNGTASAMPTFTVVGTGSNAGLNFVTNGSAGYTFYLGTSNTTNPIIFYPNTNAGFSATFTWGTLTGNWIYTFPQNSGTIQTDAGLICLTTGGAPRMGVATLVAGTVTVSNTSVTANTQIFCSRSTSGGALGHLSTTQTASTSFTITSSSATDTSTINWLLIEPG